MNSASDAVSISSQLKEAIKVDPEMVEKIKTIMESKRFADLAKSSTKSLLEDRVTKNRKKEKNRRKTRRQQSKKK